MTHIASVAPVHNEECNVAELARRLCAALGEISTEYRVILVDDGSTDGTWAEICKAAAAERRVEGLRFSRNFGQHTAITAGLDHAEADWIVVLDGDLQDRPEVIPELYAKAQEGHDIVFAARADRPESWAYQAGQRAFYSALRSLTGTQYDARHGNFSIISARVLAQLRRISEGSRFYGGLVEWTGYPRVAITAQHGDRAAGQPSYNLVKRFKFALGIIVSFSTRPLYLSLIVGLISTIVSLSFGAYILARALFSDYAVQGWATLVVSIYFIGGLQMMLIGMNGLYIGRIHEEQRRRPLYVIRETTLEAQPGKQSPEEAEE